MLQEKIKEKIRKIQEKIKERIEYFEPWGRLLSLIQLTEDKMPINIQEISKIVHCSSQHAQDLILTLLEENKEIGSYNKEEKIYTKGVNVDDYLSQAIKIAEDSSDE